MNAKELRIGNFVEVIQDKLPSNPYDIITGINNKIFFSCHFGGFYKKEDYYIPKPYYFSEAFGYDFKLKYVHQLQNLK